MEEERNMTLKDFLEIARRRKKAIILPALGIFAIAACVAFLIPPTYRSTSTILIEDQEIPRDYVMSTVTSYAEQRLESINQRIMSSTRLLEVIKRFNLYADLMRKETIEEVIEKMRKDIKFETISASVKEQRTGRNAEATIAFSISYEGRNPDVVQQVANVLASLYLEENLRILEQQTTGASKFIEEEMSRVQGNLADIDAKMAFFKSRNLNTLPEFVQLNLQNLDQVNRDVAQLNDQLKALKEKESYLESQLAITPRDAADPEIRLKELKDKLANLQTNYTDEHPDVIKTKAEIAALERHLKTPAKEGIASDKLNNPVYVQLSQQLSTIRMDIKSLNSQIENLKQTSRIYQSRVVSGPRVEEQYKFLMAERSNTQAKYDDLMKKAMEAKVASGMEKGQLGERFTIIDPARLPERPVNRNIPAILLIGFILGIGSGVGTAALMEYSDQSVRTVQDLSDATGFLVIGGIPEITIEKDIARQKALPMKWIVGIVLVLLITLVLFHFFVMDLDVFWARLMRRLAI
jgi:polysaccharide chain length determinant protein (PEP-CTERM system associated)